jgi:hypothetical protein
MPDHSRKSISDETLMRFVDGDLPPDERSVIVGEVARNPDLTQRLEAFRFTKEELAAAFAPALEAPPELIEKILRGAAPASRFSPWKPSLVATAGLDRPNLRRQGMAIAAAVTLLLAGGAGWMLRDSTRPDHAGLVAPPSLQRALEETPSEASVKLPGDLSIRPRSTFASLQKRWCREYTVIYANRMGAPALACRGDDGIWRVETQEDPHSAPVSKNPKAYIPAGEDPQPPGGQGESVAVHRDRIMGADLSLEDEARLIKGRWERKP